MKIYTSYKIKIKHYNHILKDTLTIYRSVVDYLIPVCIDNWSIISAIDGKLNEKTYVEHLVHHTEKNPSPLYDDFDALFYKFPIYLLRSAIADAIGLVSSYMSNHDNWISNGKHGKEPKAPVAGFAFPVYYKDNCYKSDNTNPYHMRIKIYRHHDWVWMDVDLNKSDVNYVRNHCSTRKQKSPTLMKVGKQWFLKFVYEENVTLNKVEAENQTVCSVDLGINHACTCSIMESDGTVTKRLVYNLPVEEDHLNHSLNKVRKSQKCKGKNFHSLWAKANGINNRIAVLTANKIVEFALSNHCDVIVFEHLDTMHKIKGGKKMRLHMWKKQAVIAMVMTKAHRNAIRVSTVNAYNTSKLAYDGSGEVKRDENNYSLCTFKSGKQYNCDLSASYNIGARYFIRELLKPLSATARLSIEAKVPQCIRRSTCTLSTLISLNAVMNA